MIDNRLRDNRCILLIVFHLFVYYLSSKFKTYQHLLKTTKRKIKIKLFFDGYYSVLIVTITFIKSTQY
jgi:hypothetical protein